MWLTGFALNILKHNIIRGGFGGWTKIYMNYAFPHNKKPILWNSWIMIESISIAYFAETELRPTDE